MAFTLVQAGTSLQQLTTSGALTTLTLPTGVTLSSSLTPRFAIFGKYVVIVNSPSRPLIVDGDGTVRPLGLIPPSTAPVLSGAAGGSLSGTYTVKQTFRIRDADGNVITESGYGPASASATISGQYLKAASLNVSPDSITESVLYRPTTSGTTYYPWITIDGNTQTSIQDDLADASLSLIAAPTLGTIPDLTLVAEWRARLWGVSRTAIDNLRYSEAEVMYSWPASNDIPVPRIGADSRGITAFAPRRDALIIGRRNLLQQVTGTSNTDFRIVKISENCGIESQESVVIVRDTAYFLWKDGVYSLGADGLQCISDGKVRSWFATDTYLNRAKFSISFAHYEPVRNKYRLFLASAGSSTVDSWVEYDLKDKTWWGIHSTTAFTPTAAIIVPDANDTLIPMIGSSSGFLWQEQATRTDNTATGISMSFATKFHDGNTPDIEKRWGQLSVIGKVQAAGTVSVTPKTGYLDASAQSALSYDMTLGRQKLDRLGTGKLMQLTFANSTAGQNVEIYGYEVDFSEIGRR